MKFVVFHLETSQVGCSAIECYALDDNCFKENGEINDDYLCEYGLELARDNADMYGILDNTSESGLDPEECFYETHEIVEFDSLEEAKEEYGIINNF